MSGLIGGRADKLGNRYEGLWVAYQLLRLLAEEVAAVQLEALGDDERGVDVWVTQRDGTRDAQQCKRKNRSTGRWSIGELTRQGVLTYQSDQLIRNPTARFTLVSGHPAPELRELCDTARAASDDHAAYFRDTLAVAAHADNLRRFCQAVGADANDSAGRRLAFDQLRRSFTHLFEDSPEGRGAVTVLARCLIDGNPETVIEVLANFAESRLGEALTVEQVRRHLRDRGLAPTNLAGHPQAVAQVERLRGEFRESLRPSLIHSSLVPRPEARTILDLLTSQADRRLVVLHGRSGSGKSCVLLQLTELLDQASIPYLPLRLDRRTPQTSSRRYGIEGCDLPESPAVVLRSLNPGRRTVLIVDQLDAVRWTAAHASAPWEACRQVIDDALGLSDVAVVVACRTFDLRDDQQIQAWHHTRRGHEVAVGDLPDDAVAAVVAAAGGNHAELAPRQKTLLRSPLHLALWTQTVRAGGSVGGWATHADLLRAFWRSRFEAAARMSVPPTDTRDAVAALVSEMDRRGELSVPARTLDPYPKAADALRSLHVVVEADRRLTFAHQTYFEYQLAARLLDEVQRGGRSVVDWVRAGDQSLLRRDQLRLVLTLLRDEDHGEYIRTLRGLLSAPAGKVRFHLRQLALRLLGEVSGPTPQECELACELVENPAWRDHALDQVFTRHPAWLDASDDRGLLARWLAAEDGRLVDFALLICRAWSGQRGDRVARLVGPYMDCPDPWPRRVAGTLPFNPAEDAPNLFCLRLALVRRGIVRHHHLMAKELVERTPERLIDLLDVHLDRRQANLEEPANTPADERGFPYFIQPHEAEHLERVADALPLAFWERLMRHVVAACESTRVENNERHPAPFFRDSMWEFDRLFLREPNVGLPQLVARAGSRVASSDPTEFATRHAKWLNHPGLSVQHTIGLALAEADEAAADLAIGWLCDNPHRLSVPDERGDHWGIAKRIIRRHAAACSPAAYTRLEQALLSYHEPEERTSLEWQLESVRAGWPLRANDYGLSQHALLPCLPDSRLSDTARSEIGVLDRKFGRPAAECDIDRRGRSYKVVGPVQHDRAARITDRGWLQIIAGAARAWSHRDIDADTAADTSAEGFARSLNDQARFEPSRFARLALAIPVGSYPAYLAGILHAAAQTSPPNTECPNWHSATGEEVRAVIEHAGYQEDDRIATAVCWLMRQRHTSLSTPVCLELLCRYATEHPHPAPGWRVSSNDPHHEHTAISCVRGTAVGAIGQVLFAEPCMVGFFETTLRHAAVDSHPAVRVAVVEACLPILNVNRHLAVELFLSACTGPDEILATRRVSEFVRYSLWSHHGPLGPLLRRMAGSLVPAVAAAGAAWLTVVSLYGRIPRDEVDDLARGTPDQRKGVAQAAAHNCEDPAAVARCVELLGGLIDDPDEEVRAQAGEFLRRSGVLRSPEGRRLAEQYAASQDFGQHPSWLVEALRGHPDSLIPLAPVMEAVCIRVAGDLTDPARREQLQDGFALDRFVPLILRLYEQAEQIGDKRLRTACLDWWDRLLQARMGGAAQLLGNLDAGGGADF
jgi:hypothetical protein